MTRTGIDGFEGTPKHVEKNHQERVHSFENKNIHIKISTPSRNRFHDHRR